MEIATLILQIVIIISFGLVIIFIKNFIPSYVNKKGENLATKEDIADITQRTEEVQSEFRKRFELFSSDIKFKYNFFFKQYSELYCKLYAIIIQSEYVRVFLDKKDGTNVSFEEAPFVEIGPTRTYTKTHNISSGKTSIETKVDVIETDISKFNKKTIADYIISKAELSSQELLKLAVSYRFAHEYYSGNEKGLCVEELKKIADEEEFRLIKEIIVCIVKEYNGFRKKLNMSYDEEEYTTGIPHC